jgi:hypothetical protein
MKHILLCCLLLLLGNQLRGASADTLVGEGRALLVARDITNANARFAAALSLAPNHEAANVFYAATRLLTIANKPAGKALLDRFGVAETNRDIYAWTAYLPTDTNGVPVPPTNTSPTEVAAFLRTNVLAEIIGAEANLAAVTNLKFTLFLTGNETLLAKVTIDYADLLLMRAALKLAQYGIYTVNAFNYESQFTAIRELSQREGLTVEQVLKEYPQFLTFATTNDLNAARQAFSEAVALYNSASQAIRARPVADVRLFTWDPDAFASELTFRTSLNELKTSLNGPVVTSVDAHYSVNFGRHFAGTTPLRAFLPQVGGNAAIAGTLPDPTFDGLFLGATRTEIEKQMGLRKHLGIPMVSQFTVPARLADGRFHMTLNAVDGTLTAIQSSTDLATWQTLDVLVVSNGTITLLDNTAAATPTRYFRALDLSRSVPDDFVPPNDAFANRVQLTGTNISTAGFGGSATIETDEPFDTGDYGGSLWWTWTAPKSGKFHIDTFGTKFYVTLALYTGNALSGLTPINEAEGGGDYPATMTFDAVAGTTYQIAVAWYWWERPGKVLLNLFEVPANDSFDDAIELVGMTNSVIGSNVNATKEYLNDFDMMEPEHADEPGGRSVWWKWIAPVDGEVTIDTQGSSFDTLLAVYSDQDGWLQSVASNDDGAPGMELWSRVSFVAVRDATYFIAVDGYDAASGNINLNLRQTQAAAPSNNAFASAVTLQGDWVSTLGTVLGANREPGELSHYSFFYRYGEWRSGAGRSIWYKWTAPYNGEVAFWAYGDNLPPVISIYTGSSISNLSVVRDGYAYYSPYTQSEFSTFSNTTYYIALDAPAGEAGNIQFNLRIQSGSPSMPYVSESFEPLAVSVGSQAEWRPNISGSFPMRFQWKKNGTNVPGATNLQFIISAATTNDAGSYVLTATNLAGGAASAPVALSIYAAVQNDDFSHAALLVGRTNIVTSHNFTATREPGEPNHAYGYGYKSVWWTWTAPATGSVTIDTIGSDFYYAVLGVYIGNAVNSLSWVADDVGSAGGGASRVTFNATAGTTYRIAVDGYYSSMGNIVLRVRQP